MAILEAIDVTKHYGTAPTITRALDGVNLTVENGEFLAIVGASGSGKSTLLHLMGGLDVPTSGSIKVKGQDLSKMDRNALTIFRRREIGFVFQNYNLLPMMNVHDNIVLPVELDGGHVDEAYFNEVVEMLGLGEKLLALPTVLSGGQQQRVAIARALMARPSIVLADEPTGNLDSQSGREVMALLQMANRKYHQTVLLITHDERIALSADRILTIGDGKLLRDEVLKGGE